MTDLDYEIGQLRRDLEARIANFKLDLEGRLDRLERRLRQLEEGNE